jgi:alpha-1,3-rhamnosyltransferase
MMEDDLKKQSKGERDYKIGRDAPGISVVVPLYNHARFVEATLRSIFRQALSPAKLIVIDDGSKDGSAGVAERILNEAPFKTELVVRANRGLCATLNEGLARSTGEYFAYLGSDDLWLPGFLEKRVEVLERRPRAVLAYGHAYLIDAEDRILDCTAEWASYADGDARAMLRRTIAPMSPTVVYRRETLMRHGWNESARLEDYELYLRLSAEGEFAFDPQVLSAWRRHEGNASWNQKMMLEEQLSAQKRVLPEQGMSAEEIEKLQKQIRFNRAEDFLRIGDKTEAIGLMRPNIGGITSLGTAARMAARLLLPYRVMQWRSRRRVKSKYSGAKIF